MPAAPTPSYDELLQNVLARARVHNPEWTNLNPSDPGVTILELFTYLTQQLQARVEEIPEQNRRKFLSLLGVPVQPATPAVGIVTFRTEARDPMPPHAVTIPPGLEVRAGQIPFRTMIGLDSLPVDALICYKRRITPPPGSAPGADLPQLYGLAPESVEAAFYETAFLETMPDPSHLPVCDLLADTVDQAFWVALLARPTQGREAAVKLIANRTLNLGVLPAPPATRVLAPRNGAFSPEQVPLQFAIATDESDPESGMPLYRTVPVTMDVNVLQEPGVVRISLPDAADIRLWPLPDARFAGTGDFPPLLPDPKQNQLVITWLRIRFPTAQWGPGFSARLNWVDINADMVVQQVHVTGERPGKGTGEPNQTLVLVRKPVVPGTVRLTVDGRPWQETDDIMTAGPEVPIRDPRLRPGLRVAARDSQLFQVDAETGVIRFGDGMRGTRPPVGAEIVASYAYGGGTAGNVGARQLSKAPDLGPNTKVQNSLPTWGGTDRQSIADAERQLSAYLKHQDRLVTADDFRQVVLATPGVAIGRVEVLPLVNPDQPGVAAPGAVTVLVLPEPGAGDAPPEPNRQFLDAVCEQVDARRLLTTAVYVRGPVYKRFSLMLTVEVDAGTAFPPLREAVKRAIRQFLSPLTGGHEQTGWPLGKPVRAKELLSIADRLPGVAFASDAFLQDDAGTRREELALTGLELPWPALIDIRQGGLSPSGLVTAPAPADRRLITVPFNPAD